MAPVQKLLRASCLLFAAAQAEVNDIEALVQTGVRSSAAATLESQMATLKLMAEGFASLSKPHHKHGGSQDAAPAKSSQSPPAGCTKKDFWAVSYHIKEIIDEYKPKFEAAQKEGDTETMSELVEDIIPSHCNMKVIVRGMSINWDKLETCLTEFSNVTSSCVRCPINFMKKVIGRNTLEAPLSCAFKCAPLGAASFKCGEASDDGCDDNMLDKAAPCMACVNPKLVELNKCTGMPHADELEGKLNKIKEAVVSGEDALSELMLSEAEQGREELKAVAKTGTNLQRVATLMFSAALD